MEDFFIGKRTHPQPGGVAAPACVPEGKLRFRKTGQRVGLDEGCVQSLFGDAVAEKSHSVAVAQCEPGFLRPWLFSEQGAGKDGDKQFFHCVVWIDDD